MQQKAFTLIINNEIINTTKIISGLDLKQRMGDDIKNLVKFIKKNDEQEFKEGLHTFENIPNEESKIYNSKYINKSYLKSQYSHIFDIDIPDNADILISVSKEE